jgi:hypothetical protein
VARDFIPQATGPARRFVFYYLLVILAVTLAPAGGPAAPGWESCLICGNRGVADAFLNVLFFAPLGAGLILRGWRAGPALGAAGLLSLCIEIAQLWVPGRHSTTGDVLFNLLGAALGIAVIRSASSFVHADLERTRALAAVTAIVVVGAFVVTPALMQPAPLPSVLIGDWIAERPYQEEYGGTVLSARAGEILISPGGLETAPPDPERWPLTIELVAGPPPKSMAHLVGLYDARGRELLFVGIQGGDVLVRRLNRGAALRLDQPGIRAAGLLDGAVPGERVVLTIEPQPAGLCFTAGASRRCEPGWSIGRGWGLLFASDFLPEKGKRGIDFLWIAALLLPLGFWITISPHSAVGIGGALLALGLAPLWAGLLPTSDIEWAGAFAGLIGGGVARCCVLRVGARRRPLRAASSTGAADVAGMAPNGRVDNRPRGPMVGTRGESQYVWYARSTVLAIRRTTYVLRVGPAPRSVLPPPAR